MKQRYEETVEQDGGEEDDNGDGGDCWLLL